MVYLGVYWVYFSLFWVYFSYLEYFILFLQNKVRFASHAIQHCLFSTVFYFTLGPPGVKTNLKIIQFICCFMKFFNSSFMVLLVLSLLLGASSLLSPSLLSFASICKPGDSSKESGVVPAGNGFEKMSGGAVAGAKTTLFCFSWSVSKID